MAVTSRPTLKKTSINFGNFGGQEKLGNVSPIHSKVSSANHIKSLRSQRRVLERVITLEEDVRDLTTRVKMQDESLVEARTEFKTTLTGIRNSIGQLQSGQQAIIEGAKNKEEIEAKQRQLEEQRLKREGASAQLEGPVEDAKNDVNAKLGPLEQVGKTSMGILERLKKFLLFVVAGWFTDKTIKLINAFSSGNKEKINEIGKKLLIGAGVVGGIMLLATGAIGPVLGGIGSLIGILGGLLFNPVTLTALLVAVGVGGAIWGIRKLWKWGRTRVTGGEKFKDKHDELDKKLKDAGMDIAGAPNQFKGRSGAKRMGELENKGRTEEQQKLWEEVEAERKRINGIRDAMRKEMNDAEKEWRDSVSGQGRQKGKKLQSAEKKGELAEKKAQIRSKYEAMIDTGVSISSGDGSNVGSTASGDTSAAKVAPANTNEGSVTVVPNFVQQVEEASTDVVTNVVPLDSGNKDNNYILDAKTQFNMY